ncbi:MAG: anaerobic ribonucleoside-triphosphate reductase activating protein [Coprobacillus sp.]|nr:anaerobic ribonucleoside-triphosphate reductase activating protein [Coprobacillus sp.]
MNIVGYEKLTLVDYPEKVACILFLKGCNFLCPFCHNKELVLPSSEEVIPFNDVLDFLKSRAGKLDAVVISGGEPTLDPDLVYIIKEIKKLGYLVKLDTNGSNPELLQYLIDHKLIDYCAMDIKNSPEKYNLTAGASVDLSAIQKSVRILENDAIDYEFRMTTIEEFHKDEDIYKIGEFLKGAKRFYFQKYEDNENCIVGGFHPVEEKKIRQWTTILSNYINDVNLRGY